MTIYFNPHNKDAQKVEAKKTYECEYCGKELKSASGKTSHKKACSENPENSLEEEGGE